MNDATELTVFLVDDDDVACESVSRSFRKHNIPFPIVTAEDGVEALQVLRGQHHSKQLNGPIVILLDLNMPRMNGFEFLQELRADPDIASHVVFVLTTSNDDKDRSRAYAEHIAGYMLKSAVGPQFSKLTSLLTNYKSSVTLPG
ncbi:MAG: response regulator [Chromatiales bacterium]|jgi:CheY-like chemotaxis protein